MAAFTSYTLDQYRRIPDPIRSERWAGTSNPHRPFRTDRGGWPILLIGIHITAGIDDYTTPDTSADATTNWGRTTPDASWHACIDSYSIIPFLPDTYVAWVQGVPGYNFNLPGLGLEIGAKSTNWDAKPAQHVDGIMRHAAAWLAPRVIAYGIPLRVLRNRDEIQRLINSRTPVGFVGHHVLTPETRSDPGWYKGRDTFPWQKLLDYTSEEATRRRGHLLLRPGDTVTPVRELQTLLNENGAHVDVDGDYGPATEKAVRAFQTARRLDVDGIAGPATLTALRKGNPTMTPDQIRDAVASVIYSKEAARQLFTAHPILRRNPEDTGGRVSPSYQIERAANNSETILGLVTALAGEVKALRADIAARASEGTQ